MLRRRTFTIVSLALVVACSEDDAGKPSGSGTTPPDLTGVIYAGGTTDEALERLADTKAKDDPKQYVVVDAPDLSAPLAADAPATFEFHLATQASRLPSPRPAPKGEPAPVWRRPLKELLALLGPPRVAFAHGTPFNGTGYFLEYHDASGRAVLRVFTAKQSYTPDAEAWQSLARASQPITLDITSAFFEDNDIPADGGPFIGGSFGLTIE